MLQFAGMGAEKEFVDHSKLSYASAFESLNLKVVGKYSGI